jgi:hypothetical protein
MSGSPRPRGRLPRRVYWFRRLLVLGVALGLVFGLAQLLGATAGSSDVDSPSATVVAGTPTSSSSITPDASPSSGGPGVAPTSPSAPVLTAEPEDGSDGASGKPSNTPPPEPSGPCLDDDVVATPEILGEAHAGSPVRIRVTLTSVRSEACTWTVSPRTLAVRLTSGDDRIWSSQDCKSAIPEAADVTVRREKPTTAVEVSWIGRRSDAECSTEPGWAQPGYYYVEATTLGGEPSDLQFELGPAIVKTKTAKPKPTPKRDAEAGEAAEDGEDTGDTETAGDNEDAQSGGPDAAD